MTQRRLENQVAIVTGASRGIGRAVAGGLAREGATVVVAAKSVRPRAALPGTIHDTATAITGDGGRALAVPLNVRKDDQIEALVDRTLREFGRIDIVIHNAGALWWRPVMDTPMKRFDLVMDVNVRGAFSLTRACLPAMIDGGGGHVVVYSPPLDLQALTGKVAYLISKFGMTLFAMGLAGELRDRNVAANALWPVTAIESQATRHFKLGTPATWRTPEILVDATLEIVSTPPEELTGRALLDEPFLRERGWTDFTPYRCDPDHEPPPLSLQELPDAGFGG